MNLNPAVLDSLLVTMISLNESPASAMHITSELLLKHDNPHLTASEIDRYLAFIHASRPDLLKKEVGNDFFYDAYIFSTERAVRFLHEGGFENSRI